MEEEVIALIRGGVRLRAWSTATSQDPSPPCCGRRQTLLRSCSNSDPLTTVKTASARKVTETVTSVLATLLVCAAVLFASWLATLVTIHGGWELLLLRGSMFGIRHQSTPVSAYRAVVEGADLHLARASPPPTLPALDRMWTNIDALPPHPYLMKHLLFLMKHLLGLPHHAPSSKIGSMGERSPLRDGFKELPHLPPPVGDPLGWHPPTGSARIMSARTGDPEVDEQMDLCTDAAARCVEVEGTQAACDQCVAECQDALDVILDSSLSGDEKAELLGMAREQSDRCEEGP